MSNSVEKAHEMTERPQDHVDFAELSLHDRMDVVCDAFEAEWLAGRTPQLEEFLYTTEEREGSSLFRQLLNVELAYRGKRSDAATPADYASRFPDQVQSLAEVFRRLAPDNPASRADNPVASTHTELLNDRYRLIRELGHGGMAVVHLAEDVETGRQVAVKMMNARMTGTAKQRFTREFSTIASIKHPHCLDVYEYGESDAGPFFAMELFEGEPATALIGQPREVILKATHEMAEAIDFVHTRRIIHRDIKPGNILVRGNAGGSGFEVKLADFGLAKFANTSSTMSGETDFLGTVAYCAPEQIMREDLDQRTDLYSFGVVCYELLTGHHPYEASRKHVQALVAKHLKETPPPLRQSAPDLPVEIEQAVMQMLAKEARSRPS